MSTETISSSHKSTIQYITPRKPVSVHKINFAIIDVSYFPKRLMWVSNSIISGQSSIILSYRKYSIVGLNKFFNYNKALKVCDLFS